MSTYTGVIIEESLEDKSILKHLKITSTEIEDVTKRMNTTWLKQWTLHTIEVAETDAPGVAEEISRSLEATRSNWYADFKNDTHHYIIFRDKVFFIDRTSREQYGEARRYGISLGIPEHQVDFENEVIGRSV